MRGDEAGPGPGPLHRPLRGGLPHLMVRLHPHAHPRQPQPRVSPLCPTRHRVWPGTV